MKKVIKIEDKDIEFALDGRAPIIYRAIFGSDYFSDMRKIKSDDEEDIDFSLLLQFAYMMAHIANEDIGSFLEWLEIFDNPIHFLNTPEMSKEDDEEKTKKLSKFTPSAQILGMLSGNTSAAVSDHKKKQTPKQKNQES